jgi:hypothetical protein
MRRTSEYFHLERRASNRMNIASAWREAGLFEGAGQTRYSRSCFLNHFGKETEAYPRLSGFAHFIKGIPGGPLFLFY